MSDSTLPSTTADRLRNALDWTVFSLGIVSLSIAIGATVLTKSNLLQTDNSPAAATTTVTG